MFGGDVIHKFLQQLVAFRGLGNCVTPGTVDVQFHFSCFNDDLLKAELTSVVEALETARKNHGEQESTESTFLHMLFEAAVLWLPGSKKTASFSERALLAGKQLLDSVGVKELSAKERLALRKQQLTAQGLMHGERGKVELEVLKYRLESVFPDEEA